MSRERTRADAITRGAPEGERAFGLREWVDRLPSGRHDERLATFDTKMATMRHLPGSAAKAAAKVARSHGYTPAAPAESFYVEDVDGPLLCGETDRATAWGRRLATSLRLRCTSPRRRQRRVLSEDKSDLIPARQAQVRTNGPGA